MFPSVIVSVSFFSYSQSVAHQSSVHSHYALTATCDVGRAALISRIVNKSPTVTSVIITGPAQLFISLILAPYSSLFNYYLSTELPVKLLPAPHNFLSNYFQLLIFLCLTITSHTVSCLIVTNQTLSSVSLLSAIYNFHVFHPLITTYQRASLQPTLCLVPLLITYPSRWRSRRCS